MTQTTKTKRDRLVWVDCEMTGLDPEKDTLLEVAAIVTEGDLSIVAEGPNLEWSPSHLENYTRVNLTRELRKISSPRDRKQNSFTIHKNFFTNIEKKKNAEYTLYVDIFHQSLTIHSKMLYSTTP